MVGNVNKGRFELHEWIDVVKEDLDILSFQRREYLNAEEGFVVGVFEVVCDFHL